MPCTADQASSSAPGRSCVGHDSRVDHGVERVGEQLEGGASTLAGSLGGRGPAEVDRHGERRAEQTRLVHGEAQVADADGPEAGPRPRAGIEVVGHGVHRGADDVGGAGLRPGDDLAEERVAVREVAVGRIGRDAGATSRLTQDDLVGAALAGEVGAGLEQGAAQVTVVVGRPGSRGAGASDASRAGSSSARRWRRRTGSQAHHAPGRRGGRHRLRVGRRCRAQNPKRRAVPRTASAEARRPDSSSSVIGTSMRSPTPPAWTIAGTDRQTSLMP